MCTAYAFTCCILVLQTVTLPLVLECDRFSATPEEDRICLLCELGKIEIKVHFLFCCPIFVDVRDVLYTKISSTDADLFWLDDYEILDPCLRRGTKSELQNNM